jgi:predicted transport protein
MDALGRGGSRARELYLMLRERIETFERNNGDNFDERVMKYWISVRSSRKGKVFAEIRLNKEDIDIFILPEACQLVDHMSLARPVPLNQGWGWFRSRFWLRNETQLDSALELIQQSYHSA